MGLRIGKWAGILGAVSSYLLAALLIGFGIFVAWRSGPATHFHLMPALNFNSLNFWSQIAFAFVGLEVAPILGGEIFDPDRAIPRAAWISGGYRRDAVAAAARKNQHADRIGPGR